MKNLLLVEGKDDVYAVSELLRKRGLTQLRVPGDKAIRPLKLLFGRIPLDIMPMDDAARVIGKFRATLKNESNPLKAIGLILDFDAPNEEQANERDNAVRNEIVHLQKKRRRWHLEEDFKIISPKGFIAEPVDVDTPRVGAWLMPDNQNRGMLETFLQRLIPEKQSKLLEHSQNSTDKAKNEYAAPFKPVHQEKAVVHTFLAWMDEPGAPFGTSFQNGSFDAKSALANKFVEWMQKLFRD